MLRKRLLFVTVPLVVLLTQGPKILAQVTDLQVTKSGNDAVLSWSTGTSNFAITAGSEPRFLNPSTLASDLPAGPYTYSGALTNSQGIEYMTVYGSNESDPSLAYTGGAQPPPKPIIGSVSPTSGLKVGDILTINGQGFSTVAKDNIVHFPQGMTTTANASPPPTATSFQVTIPRGALSGPMCVQVGHQISATSSLSIFARTGFSQIRGVAFQPTTRDIWVANGTTLAYTRFSGTTWGAPTTMDSPGNVVGGQGFDSAGTWYAGRTTLLTNGGTRQVPTNPPAAGSAFTQIAPGSGDTIGVLAAATHSTLSAVAYFAYNNTTDAEKHIRKLGAGGVLDADYGNFGAYDLNFAGYAGLALDQAGNLYDTETTLVRQITPAESSSIILSGFTSAMGLALDQVNASDPGELLVTDNGASTIFGVDLLLPEKQTIASGLSIPRAATFATTPLRGSTCGKLPNIDLAFVLTGEATQVRQLPDPRITMLPSAPTKVWISKGRADDLWPSDFQSADHQVLIIAEGGPGRRICFRVVDPPDLAPYADFVTTGDWCDNRDPGTSNDAGKLWDPVSSSWQNVVCLTANEHGVASTVLNTTNRFAGDNYIVQASYDTWDSTAASKALAQTGVITAWKRNYIELDDMFREGGLLTQDAPTGDSVIVVHPWANLPACGSTPGATACYQIAVIDSDHPYEVLPGYDTVNPHDEPYVSHVTDDGSGNFVLHLVHEQNSPFTSYNLTQSYTHSGYPQFTSGNSAGIGVLGGFHAADVSYLWHNFSDGFVEYWVPPDGRSRAPYLPENFFDAYDYVGPTCNDRTQKSDYNTITTRWYRFGWLWNAHHAETNYLWLGGSRATPPLNAVACRACSGANAVPQLFGLTRPITKQAFIFAGAVEVYSCLSSYWANAIRFVTVHELGHDYYLNPNDPGGEGHDERCQWPDDGGATCAADPIPTCTTLNNADGCIMNMASDPWQYKHRFDRWDLICADPACGPGGPPGCCEGCAVPGDGTIRDFADPFVGVAP